MQLIKATAPLFLAGLAAAAPRTRDGRRPLAGALPARAAALDARYVQGETSNAAGVMSAEAAAGYGYTYTLSVNASLPVDDRIDKCIAWPAEDADFDTQKESNGVNFTWFGFRLALPDDATTPSGFRYSQITGATRDLGYVQAYDTTAELLEYNMTTVESQPTVHLNFNDELFSDTFTFDFVEGGDGAAAVSDGGDYQEFTKALTGAIYCWTVLEENSRQSIFPVVPTLTIAMRRLAGPAPPPTPAPSAAGAVATRGRSASLGVFAAAVTWASAAYV